MADSSKTDKKVPTPKEPPEQKLGDTPTPPWAMPTAQEKAAAQPVRRALQQALDEVDSPEKADQVIRQLEAQTTGQKIAEVAQQQPAPATPAEAAQQVVQAKQAAPPGEKATQVLAETARVAATAEARPHEVVAQAAQEMLNPQQQGAPTVVQEEQRAYLRQAVLKRLKPLEALDARLFLAINHLPHTSLLNRLFYTLTLIFTGGAAWYGLMGLITFRRPQLGWQIVRQAVLPLAIATWLVEYPIKWFFRRRRPFISIIQAIVIGKKPGSWSFPSGHSATAFAGAWLFSRYLPRWRGLLYTVAGLVAFSRIYLGDHYPGDVLSGSGLGVLFAMLCRWLLGISSSADKLVKPK